METQAGKMETPEQLWKTASESLKKMSKVLFDQFFCALTPVRLEGDTLLFSVPLSNDFLGDVVVKNYSDFIEEALSKAAGKPMHFKIEAGLVPESAARKETPAVPVAAPAAVVPDPVVEKTITSVSEESKTSVSPFSTHVEILPRNTFANFVIGEGNRYAYTCAEAAANRPGTYNPLYIYGETGMGKTHLMQAVANHVMVNNPKANICYTPSEAFLNEFVNASINHTFSEFRDYYRKLDLLLIDDVHNLGGKKQLQEEFFNTFNAIYNHGGQIILASDKLPQEIDGLEARLVSRFQLGVTTQITEPSYETRLAILKLKQQYQSVKLPQSLLSFIAERVTSQVRALEGALTRIIAFCTTWNRTPDAITPSILEGLLGDILDSEAAVKHVDIDRILSVTADYYNIHVSDIVGTKRPRNIAQARMVAMYLARSLTDLSLKEIGQAFGGRNHTTVIHAVKEVETTSEGDEQLQRSISMLKRKLHADEMIK